MADVILGGDSLGQDRNSSSYNNFNYNNNSSILSNQNFESNDVESANRAKNKESSQRLYLMASNLSKSDVQKHVSKFKDSNSGSNHRFEVKKMNSQAQLFRQFSWKNRMSLPLSCRCKDVLIIEDNSNVIEVIEKAIQLDFNLEADIS